MPEILRLTDEEIRRHLSDPTARKKYIYTVPNFRENSIILRELRDSNSTSAGEVVTLYDQAQIDLSELTTIKAEYKSDVDKYLEILSRHQEKRVDVLRIVQEEVEKNNVDSEMLGKQFETNVPNIEDLCKQFLASRERFYRLRTAMQSVGSA